MGVEQTAGPSVTGEESGLRAEGGCLCEGVRYRLHGPLRAVYNCHCAQCRKTHGHIGAYTLLPRARLQLLSRGTLRWYRASGRARRGFCNRCGGSVFWWPEDGVHIAVAAGTLDSPTGLHTAGHIYTRSAGDYYRLDDGLPCATDGLTAEAADGPSGQRPAGSPDNSAGGKSSGG